MNFNTLTDSRTTARRKFPLVQKKIYIFKRKNLLDLGFLGLTFHN